MPRNMIRIKFGPSDEGKSQHGPLAFIYSIYDGYCRAESIDPKSDADGNNELWNKACNYGENKLRQCGILDLSFGFINWVPEGTEQHRLEGVSAVTKSSGILVQTCVLDTQDLRNSRPYWLEGGRIAFNDKELSYDDTENRMQQKIGDGNRERINCMEVEQGGQTTFTGKKFEDMESEVGRRREGLVKASSGPVQVDMNTFLLELEQHQTIWSKLKYATRELEDLATRNLVSIGLQGVIGSDKLYTAEPYTPNICGDFRIAYQTMRVNYPQFVEGLNFLPMSRTKFDTIWQFGTHKETHTIIEQMFNKEFRYKEPSFPWLDSYYVTAGALKDGELIRDPPSILQALIEYKAESVAKMHNDGTENYRGTARDILKWIFTGKTPEFPNVYDMKPIRINVA